MAALPAAEWCHSHGLGLRYRDWISPWEAPGCSKSRAKIVVARATAKPFQTIPKESTAIARTLGNSRAPDSMWVGAGIREAGAEDDMDDADTIKRRPDGSLDTDHYRDIAHQLRSQAARRWLHDLIDILRWRRRDALAGRRAGDGQP